MVENYKSRREWKDIINKLEYSDFQNLVYDLLNALEFYEISQRGGGADGGRDLEAYFNYRRPNGEEYKAKCWIQCKKQASGVSFSQVHEDITRASNQKIDEYYILSNSDTTPDCKDESERGKSAWFCKIIDWTGLKFQDILFNHPDICKYYFPDEEVPPITDIRNPNEALSLSSEIGERFGIKFEFKTDKQIDLNNPADVGEVLKDGLLKIQDIDINLQALIYQKVSMFFFGLNRVDDALMFLDRSLDITPKNTIALLNKGFILERIDEVEESNSCYDEILTVDPKNKFALTNKAFNLIRIGYFEDALTLVEEALKVDSNSVNAISNKANALKGLKKPEEALAFLDEKKELIDKSINLQLMNVDLCIVLLDLKEAQRINEEILAENPDHIDAINNKGVIFEKNSKFQHKDKYLVLAMDWFEKVIDKNDKYQLGWSNKVVVLLNTNQIEEAEKIINFAYAHFPRNPYVLNKKGVVLLNKGKPIEAIKYFNKALKFRFNEDFLLQKARAQLRQSHNKEAKETAEKLLKYNPENSEAWEVKGLALRNLHQLTMASHCFSKAERFKEKPISLLEND
jgi:tetratricopeptide (TPR) repeat protein